MVVFMFVFLCYKVGGLVLDCLVDSYYLGEWVCIVLLEKLGKDNFY